MALLTKPSSGRIWCKLAWALFASYGLLILFTYTEYGITNDEVSHAKYGLDITRWYTSLFQNTEVFNSANTWLYGGFYDTVTPLVASSLPLDIYETRHLINALTGLLGVLAVYRLGTLLGGPATGFLAALLLVLTPRYFGHTFNNPKDIPFAVCYIWSIYYIVRSLEHLPQLPLALLIKTGLAIGFTLGIRIGGIVLVGYLLVFSILTVILSQRSEGIPHRTFKRLLQLLRPLLSVAGIAYSIIIVFWPWAQRNPVTEPVQTLTHFSSFPEEHLSFFEG